MDKQKMLEILFELKNELKKNKSLELHQRQTMEALVEEISHRVSVPEVSMSGDEFILAKLKEETEKFESDHPKLTQIIGRVSDLLARMGI